MKGKRALLALAVAVFVLMLGTAHADVMITEIMINPLAASDANGEWFELFNSGGEAEDLAGWTISDDGGSTFTISALTIEAGDYAVFARDSNPNYNGHVVADYDYPSAMILDETGDEIIVRDASANLVDEVWYDGNASWSFCEGATIQLMDTNLDNNDPGSWVISTTVWYPGNWDFGTPGTVFDGPYDPPALVVSEIMYQPNAAGESNGEWFEVYNAGTDTTNLRLWWFSDLGGQQFRVESPVFVAPGDYAVLARDGNPNYNGGVTEDFAYGNALPLDNVDDEIILTDPSGDIHDEVMYDELAGWPTASGASMQLTNTGANNNDPSNWVISRVAWQGSYGDFGTPGLGFDGPYLPQTVIISEILYDPNAAGDSNAEWFELYNSSDVEVNLRLWEFFDDGGNYFRIQSNVFVPAGEYAVLAVDGNPTYNGNVEEDYVYTNFPLENEDDEIIVKDPYGALQDEVWYNEQSGWPTGSGASIQLMDLDEDNNAAASWTISRNAWPGSAGDFGTPGAAFDGPYYDHHLIITEIMYDPYASGDANGEWFELYNAGLGPTNLRLWEITSAGGEYYRIQSDLIVEPGSYVVLGADVNQNYNGHTPVSLEYGGAIDLENVADTLSITDPNGMLHDEVMYDETGTWPQPFGASMQLTDLDADNNDGANWLASMWMWPGSSGDLGTPAAENGGTYPNPQIIISEIMYNPLAAGDANGEWFELHNAGADTVNLKYWLMFDLGVDSFFPTSNLVVPPGEEVVLCRDSNPTYNGHVAADYEYVSGMNLDNSADEIHLVDLNGGLIDYVNYDTAVDWPEIEGASIYLPDLQSENNDGSNWYISTLAWQGSAGDFGSPGEPNQSVPAPYTFVISEIMADPAAAGDANAEYFELFNNGPEPVNLRLWRFYDNGGDSFIIPGNVFVGLNEYIVFVRDNNWNYNGHIAPVAYEFAGAMDLDNTADEIIMEDINGTVVDEVWYDVAQSWPVTPGASMYLLNPYEDNNVPTSWALSTHPWPGSPGDFGSPNESNVAGLLDVTPTVDIVPAIGGNVVFDVHLISYLANTYPNMSFTTKVTLPDGVTQIPLLNVMFTLQPFMNLTVPNLMQLVPPGAPAGTYTYSAQAGYPTVFVTDSFTFTKLGATGAPWTAEDWVITGWPFGGEVMVSGAGEALPVEYSVGNACPNPFNPTTTLEVALPEAGELRVMVYNLNGRLVGTVADGEYQAGRHQLSFDGSLLASGVYFIRVTVPGQKQEVRKIVLMK